MKSRYNESQESYTNLWGFPSLLHLVLSTWLVLGHGFPNVYHRNYPTLDHVAFPQIDQVLAHDVDDHFVHNSWCGDLPE